VAGLPALPDFLIIAIKRSSDQVIERSVHQSTEIIYSRAAGCVLEE
jgi:hypothetical protein